MMKGYLGIDAGTQGLSVVFIDEQVRVVAKGDGCYEMVPGLKAGCFEQNPADWVAALQDAMNDLRRKLSAAGCSTLDVLAIGISGQMHGEVLVDTDHRVLGSARLWCDSRNDKEGVELTRLLGVKMPKRMTASRWLWTVRNRSDIARKVNKLTTPAGWLSHCLTGAYLLGVGDASGMFPIDQPSLTYDQQRMMAFDQLIPNEYRRLDQLLPSVRVAGKDGGVLNEQGAELLGLSVGIPVAPGEGDQPAALAGSRIAEAGTVSVSFGTSVCANSVGDHPFHGVSDAIDHFCAVDGKPINMVFLRNGTTFVNAIVEMFASSSDLSFGELIAKALEAEPDCGGIFGVPFMNDEPGLGIQQGGQAALVNLNSTNATPANAIRAALAATIMNLKIGMDVLAEQSYPRHEIVLTGGLTQTPELGQVLADMTSTKVTLPGGADEGSAVGAALLAMFRHACMQDESADWSRFVATYRGQSLSTFKPDFGTRAVHETRLAKHRDLVDSYRCS